MTDARFPERWLSDRRIMRLGAEDFRAFITSLAWSVSNRTDGVIEPEDLPLIPHFAERSARALTEAGLWTARKRGWFINGYEATQTTREQLEHLDAARAKERDKKARQRAAKAAASAQNNNPVPGDIPGDIPPDDTGQDRTGQDRQPSGEQPTARNGSPYDTVRGAK